MAAGRQRRRSGRLMSHQHALHSSLILDDLLAAVQHMSRDRIQIARELVVVRVCVGCGGLAVCVFGLSGKTQISCLYLDYVLRAVKCTQPLGHNINLITYPLGLLGDEHGKPSLLHGGSVDNRLEKESSVHREERGGMLSYLYYVPAGPPCTDSCSDTSSRCCSIENFPLKTLEICGRF